ncbi:hypothetical protein GWN63_05415 [Candidatus Bathyarchaeota archaeon]|nr:hypothetical protein [Candidatus Bathyarchaeota archaeon]NIU81662.1 hypothetical protein [Candidatus Bathyarchaeota archaeon]NIV68304.1 hypothetical protein [Candidatus Bathyarchaeota archaeon]
MNIPEKHARVRLSIPKDTPVDFKMLAEKSGVQWREETGTTGKRQLVSDFPFDFPNLWKSASKETKEEWAEAGAKLAYQKRYSSKAKTLLGLEGGPSKAIRAAAQRLVDRGVFKSLGEAIESMTE